MFVNLLDLYKAKTHKYTHKKRVFVNGKPSWKYYYKEHHGGGVTNVKDLKEGDAFKVNYKGQEGHFHVKKTEGNKVTVVLDETGKETTLSKSELRQVLLKTHATALKENVEKKKQTLAKRKSTKAKERAQQALDRAKSKIEGFEQDNFETMPEQEKQEQKEKKQLQTQVKTAVKDIEKTLKGLKKTPQKQLADQVLDTYTKALNRIANTTAPADFEQVFIETKTGKKSEKIKVNTPLLNVPDYLDIQLYAGGLDLTINRGEFKDKILNILTASIVSPVQALNFSSTAQKTEDLTALEKQIVRKYIENHAEVINEFLSKLPSSEKQIKKDLNIIRGLKTQLREKIEEGEKLLTEGFYPSSVPKWDEEERVFNKTKGSPVGQMFGSTDYKIEVQKGKLVLEDSFIEETVKDYVQEEKRQVQRRKEREQRQKEREQRQKEQERNKIELSRKEKEKAEKFRKKEAERKARELKEREEYAKEEMKRRKETRARLKREQEEQQEKAKAEYAEKERIFAEAKSEMNLEIDNFKYFDYAMGEKVGRFDGDKEFVDTYLEYKDLLGTTGKKIKAKSGAEKAEFDMNLFSNQTGRFQLGKNMDRTLTFYDSKTNEFRTGGVVIENSTDMLIALKIFEGAIAELNKSGEDFESMSKKTLKTLSEAKKKYENYPTDDPALEFRVKHAKAVDAVHAKQVKLEKQIEQFNNSKGTTSINAPARDLKSNPLSSKDQKSLEKVFKTATSKDQSRENLMKVYTSSKGELFASNGHMLILGKEGTSKDTPPTQGNEFHFIQGSKKMIKDAKKGASFPLSSDQKEALIKVLSVHQNIGDRRVVFEEDSISLVDENNISLYKMEIQLDTPDRTLLDAKYLKTALQASSKGTGALISAGSSTDSTPALVETDVSTSVIMPRRI